MLMILKNSVLAYVDMPIFTTNTV